jgi:hypothetical protein
VLTREEAIAALDHRVEQIAAHGKSVEFAIDHLKRTGDPPEQVAENLRLIQSRLDGEATWARNLAARLRAGDYWFDGEPNPPWPIRPVIAGPASPATPEG